MTALLSLLGATQQSGGLFSILILVLPLGALVYLMIVPQRKQRAKQAEFLSSLSVGDEVVTAGGLYGTINALEDGIAHLEVDTDVVVRVSVASLTRSAAADATVDVTDREAGPTADVAEVDEADVSDGKSSGTNGTAPKKGR